MFTTGHGESSISDRGQRALSGARSYFEQDNFEVEEWRSLGASAVPERTDLVVIAGPTASFLEAELALLSDYLDAGGRVLVLLESALADSELTGSQRAAGLSDWLAGYGIEVHDDYVIDPATQAAGVGPEEILTNSFGFHPIVEPLADNRIPVYFSLTRSLARAAEAPDRLEITELVKTGPDAWGETDLENPASYARDDLDVDGPAVLGLAVSFVVEEGTEELEPMAPEQVAEPAVEPDEETVAAEPEPEPEQTPEARLVVFGDVDFATDGKVARVGNSTLLVNTFNWLVQREHLLRIESKPPDQTSLSLTRSELSQIYFLVLLVMPGLAVVGGIWIYMRRRR